MRISGLLWLFCFLCFIWLLWLLRLLWLFRLLRIFRLLWLLGLLWVPGCPWPVIRRLWSGVFDVVSCVVAQAAIAVALVSLQADAREATGAVGAESIFIADMCAQRTFIQIDTDLCPLLVQLCRVAMSAFAVIGIVFGHTNSILATLGTAIGAGIRIGLDANLADRAGAHGLFARQVVQRYLGHLLQHAAICGIDIVVTQTTRVENVLFHVDNNQALPLDQLQSVLVHRVQLAGTHNTILIRVVGHLQLRFSANVGHAAVKFNLYCQLIPVVEALEDLFDQQRLARVELQAGDVLVLAASQLVAIHSAIVGLGKEPAHSGDQWQHQTQLVGQLLLDWIDGCVAARICGDHIGLQLGLLVHRQIVYLARQCASHTHGQIIGQAGAAIAIVAWLTDAAVALRLVIALGMAVALMAIATTALQQGGRFGVGFCIVGWLHILAGIERRHLVQPNAGHTQIGALAEETSL